MRRAFVHPILTLGPLRLDAEQSHHLRNVLRMNVGDPLELFNDRQQTAAARIEAMDDRCVSVTVLDIRQATTARSITLAAAVPKGDRADWMIEKLSELGVTRFVPLVTDRSVVHPTGEAKFERWRRLAAESAKQCRRDGVMRIEPLTRLVECLDAAPAAIYLTTEKGAAALRTRLNAPLPTTLLIGPEGGWSDSELAEFQARGLTGAALTATILRVETAAVAAAVIAAAL